MTRITEMLRREWRRIFPSDAICLANSNTATEDARAASGRAFRLQAAAHISKDPDDWVDAGVGHKNAEAASRSIRDSLSTDMHAKNAKYCFGQSGASQSAIANSLSLKNNPFIAPRADNSGLPQQFVKNPELPPAQSTLDRTIGATPEQIAALMANPDSCSPVEAQNLVTRETQRRIEADETRATYDQKLRKYYKLVTQDNPRLYQIACSKFKKPSQDDSVAEPEFGDDQVSLANYRRKFNELLPLCNGDAVRVAREIKMFHREVLPSNRKH